jgi:hypothetical protein
MTDAERRREFREKQKYAHDLVVHNLAAIRKLEVSWRNLQLQLPNSREVFQMKDRLRQARKMLVTLDRKMRFARSSLFLQNADKKFVDKTLASQLKTTMEIVKLTTKLTKESADFRAYMENKVQAARLAKQKKD